MPITAIITITVIVMRTSMFTTTAIINTVMNILILTAMHTATETNTTILMTMTMPTPTASIMNTIMITTEFSQAKMTAALTSTSGLSTQ